MGGEEPRSPPVAAYGNVLATTSAGLRVYDAGGGALLWTVNSAPPPDALQGGYTPVSTFDESQGQLALVRCLGDAGQQNPASICAYSGYAPAPPTPGTSGAARRGGGGVALPAAVTAAAAAGGVLLLLLAGL